MLSFDDQEQVTDEDVDAAARIAVRQGVPEAWVRTPEFRRNVVRLFTAMGAEGKDVVLSVTKLVSQSWLLPVLERIAQRSAGAGGLLTLARTLVLPALDQSAVGVEPPELYEAMPGFQPEHTANLIDLSTADYAERFFFNHDERSIDQALAAIEPDVVCVGSGPGCAAALWSIMEQRPRTKALVLDLGDYYSQADYDARSPTAMMIETMRYGGGQLILNGTAQASANMAPQVWGGGAEVFSGTAHALPDWYLDRMPMTVAERERHLRRVHEVCRIRRTPWEILNDAQKIFYKGAEALGHKPYLLEGFGRGHDTGNGRCYAGKKDRIPYLDQIFARSENVIGVANCRVDSLLRDPLGQVCGLELSFISRVSRQPMATRTLRLKRGARVLLGANSTGNHRILSQSGDRVARSGRPGVLHQYTSEIAALFDRPLSANGIPQGMGMKVVPEERLPDGNMLRPVAIEGAHPGRPTLAALGLNSARDLSKAWQATPRVGVVGIMFTERHHGIQWSAESSDWTLQKLTQSDFDRAALGLQAGMRVWQEAGARGVALNLPVRFESRFADLRELGFVAPEEIDALTAHVRKQPPVMVCFYRTGHRFGTVAAKDGAVPGFSGAHLVGEDAIPPGPGVNPTLAILLLAHQYGEQIARLL